MDDVRETVGRVAGDSYGRLIAFLSARSRDVAAAEDALSEAFQAALLAWPLSGLPDKPEAWLLVTARRKLIDAARHKRMQIEALPELMAVADEAYELASGASQFPDERLQLMFVCAHPAIDVAARTPLMLQTVLGLDAARIASAFLMKPAAMGQRLARVKTKIRVAGIPFEIPEEKDLSERLDAVLEAIYAAYGTGWDDIAGADDRRKGLAAEAVALGHLLLQQLPTQPEVNGLLSLMLYCEARRRARVNESGEYVPLSEQDTGAWNWELLEQAHHLLLDAERANKIGPFQLEAAIQSVHTRRALTGSTDWEEIALLYEGLIRIAPTMGALVGRAAAVAQARGPDAGWVFLEAIPKESVVTYQPYWALAAHLLKNLGHKQEASAAYERAIGLCEDQITRAFLTRQRCI